MRLFRSLFARTAAVIGVAILVYDLLTHAFLGYYLFMPMAKRSSDDLAALMVITAESWSSRWAPERPDFADRLAQEHELRVDHEGQVLAPIDAHSPYLTALSEALERRTGAPVEFLTGRDATWYWVDVPIAGEPVRIGFNADRLGMDPLISVFIMLVLGSLLAFGTALVFVRRINRPLGRLVNVARRIGQGEFPDALPLTGPEEIAELTSALNHMSTQVKELLAGRTTMLIGVSHDLRTPLARMQFAIEMLSPHSSPKLVAALRRDVEEMNELVARFLEIGRGFSSEGSEELEIGVMLDELIDSVDRLGGRCERVGWHECTVLAQPMALRRILSNLLDNAMRYGGDGPVTVTQSCEEEQCVICIADRGPGVPVSEQEAVFRPFYRLDHSRSARTGGAGLGLAIARQLAEANGWKVALRARQGGGSEALLSVPRKVRFAGHSSPVNSLAGVATRKLA
ncbi:MAG TPA: ATP-binding protein [Rhodocyclaceae bacterium]|jgi:two-component system, OmpR family, osmolarity sensor histidine kinase EnvZ|nr:ATP-binding protein [Rhodocyclaceae bacterium]HRQ48552.1 ATP-binding protein [Rhodocyclaceae bacterium]